MPGISSLELNRFCAIDFETADYGPDSACSLAVVRVIDGTIVEKKHLFIKPPRSSFTFTYIHGIGWEQVKGMPTFAQWWPTVAPLFNEINFIAAHNASFDRKVLVHCCEQAGFLPPQIPYLCTVSLARKAWNIRPTTLNNVCNTLNIPLVHHEALSDALACAKIIMLAREESRELPGFMGKRKVTC